MVSTYYIYYIVTTYYVINGITIVKYLHTVNANNGGKAWYIATVCALYKRGLYAAMRHAIELHGAIYTLLVWALGLVTLTLSRSTLSRSSIGFGTRLVCAPFLVPPKKNMCFPV
jgi:hypothetical protein